MVPHKRNSLWARMPPAVRSRGMWWLWFITWLGLLAGLGDRTFWHYVVFFSAFHALLVFSLFGWRISPFPVQVRVAYFLWVAVGTFIPSMEILMFITIAGLATNLFLEYCPLARMLYLLPWNRDESFSVDLLRRVFFSQPKPGKFTPPPPAA